MELRHSCWIVATTHARSCNMWASRITFQHHQIFRLPWKMTEETWQTAEPSFTSRVATRVTLQHRQILRLPRNKRFQDMTEIFGNAETSFTMRARSENDPTMNPSVRNPQCNWGFFSRSPCASGFEKYNMWRSGYRSKFHHCACLNATSSNVAPGTKIECASGLQPNQILCLPRIVCFSMRLY